MPNQATRRRRRQAGLPSNVETLLDEHNEELGWSMDGARILVSRIGPELQVASSAFLVLGNSPDVLMSWLTPFTNSQTGYRIETNPTYTIWFYKTVEQASFAVQEFKKRKTIKLPDFVPDRIRYVPMFLMNVIRPNEHLTYLSKCC